MMNKVWWDMVAMTVEHVALWLTQFDLVKKWRAPWVSRDHYVFECFDHALEVFTVMWALLKPIPNHLHFMQLCELSTLDLFCLHDQFVQPCN